jgi:hypothetical protein
MKEASDKLVFNVTNVFAPNGTYLVRTWALLVDPNNTETPVNEWTSKVITTNSTGKSITTSYSVNKSQAQAGRRGQVCSMGPGGCVQFYCKYLIFENEIYDEPSDATTYHQDWELFVKQRFDVSASMNISLSDYSVLAPLAT